MGGESSVWQTRRGRRARVALGAVLLVVCCVLIGRRLALRAHAPIVLRLTTGEATATYARLGRTLSDSVAREGSRITLVTMPSGGGRENVARIDAGEAELGFVSNDAPGGSRVRVIAPLHDEVLHVLAADGSRVDAVPAMRGRRVAIGLPASDTNHLARRVLAHFGVGPSEITLFEVPHGEAARMLARGEVDVVFVKTGLWADVVRGMLDGGRAHLVPLGRPGDPGSALDGLLLRQPHASAFVIPERTYGAHPDRPVATIAVRALLVARSDLDRAVVHDLTRMLFEAKGELSEREPLLLRLSETFKRDELRYAVHPGADAYYRRDEPNVLARQADVIGAGAGVVGLLVSAGVAVRSGMKRRRRRHVNEYYAEVGKALEAWDAAGDGATRVGIEDLGRMRERLRGLRRDAFRDLRNGDLAADESFTIFQDYLRSELTELADEIQRRGEGE